MTDRKDGGPAFPKPHLTHGPDGRMQEASAGMSLRDYFAAKALQARLTLKDGRTRDEIVEDAYDDADAMLKERSK